MRPDQKAVTHHHVQRNRITLGEGEGGGTHTLILVIFLTQHNNIHVASEN